MLAAAGYPIKKAAEVGVYSFSTSNLKPLIEAGTVCHLFEAIPDYAEKIRLDVERFEKTSVFNFAVADYNGKMSLCMAGASTFNRNQNHSPAINHDKFEVSKAQTLQVDCRKFSEVDPGDFDYLSIDVEGGEFYVLKDLVSRPIVLNIETQSRDYINPLLGSITDWMVEHGYKVWFRNDTDTLFIKEGGSRLGPRLALNRWWHNQRYFAGRL